MGAFDDLIPTQDKPAAPKKQGAFDDLIPSAPASPERTVSGTLGDIGVDAVKGLMSVPEAAVGLADLATGGAAGKSLAEVGFRPKEAKQAWEQLYSPARKAAGEKFAEVEGIGGKFRAAVENPSVVASAVVESLPLIAAGGAVGRGLGAVSRLSVPARAAIGEGVVAAGSSAEGIRQETPDGRLTPKQSLLAAGSGAATAALGFAGGKLAQKLGIGDIDVLAAGGKTTGASKNLVRRTLEGAATEGLLEELPQSVQEQVAQNAALGKPLYEGVDEAAVLGTLSGGVMGATASAFSKPRTSEDAKKDKALSDQLTEKFPEAEVKVRNGFATVKPKEGAGMAGPADAVLEDRVEEIFVEEAATSKPAQEPPKPLEGESLPSSNREATAPQELPPAAAAVRDKVLADLEASKRRVAEGQRQAPAPQTSPPVNQEEAGEPAPPAPAEPRKIFRGEFPFEEGAEAGESKGVSSGAYWTPDREMAQYYADAGGKRSDGYIREAEVAPDAKVLDLFDEEGIGAAEYERITGEAFDPERVVERGLGPHTQKFIDAGYDIVDSMDMDGPETLVLNPAKLKEIPRVQAPAPAKVEAATETLESQTRDMEGVEAPVSRTQEILPQTQADATASLLARATRSKPVTAFRVTDEQAGFKKHVVVENPRGPKSKRYQIVKEDGSVTTPSEALIERYQRVKAEGKVQAVDPADPAFRREDPIASMRQGISKYLKREVTDQDYAPASVPEAFAEVLPDLEEVTGKKIVFFNQGENAPIKIGGVTNIAPDTIYINAKSKKPHLTIFGHELLHNIEREAPEIYDEFLGVLKSVSPVGAMTKYKKGLDASVQSEGRGPAPLGMVESEFAADAFGERMVEQQFWVKVQMQMGDSAFERLVFKIQEVLSRLKAAIKNDAVVSDIEKVQDAAAKAFTRYARQRREISKIQETIPEIQLAREDSDEPTKTNFSGLPADERLRLLAGLDGQVGGRIFGGKTPRVSDNSTLSRKLDAVAGVFGHSVTLVAGSNSSGPDGFANALDRRHVYIFEGAEDPHLVVLGHELTHQMKISRPDLYQELLQGLYDLRNDADLKDHLFKAYSDKLVPEADGSFTVPPNIMEEWVAEVVGRNMASKGFWNAFGEAQPSLASQVAKFISGLLKAVKGKFQAQLTERTLKDMDRAEKLTAEVFAKYADKTPNFSREQVFYHGTDQDFESYRTPSWFTTDPSTASSYASDREGANVRPVVLDLKNPYEVEAFEDLVRVTPGMISALKKAGFDGLSHTAEDGQTTAVPFDTGQVRSLFEPAFSRESSPFYSKLSEVIAGTSQKVWGSRDDLRNFLSGKASQDEIELVLADLPAEGRVSREKVLRAIEESGVELEEVVLGGAETLRWGPWQGPDAAGEYWVDASTGERIVRDNQNYYTVYDSTGEEIGDGYVDEGKAKEVAAGVATPTQFSTYVLPGAVEGSYREMFVTAPGNFNQNRLVELSEAMDKQEVDSAEFNRLVEERKNLREAGIWQDGHSQYGQIQNPVVRLRFNTREADGKKILFIEEMQGPADSQQEKMPEYLRKRIYDLGVKKALAYAKANGFDGVSWTTGEQQADRYDLSKELSEIRVRNSRDMAGMYEIKGYNKTLDEVINKSVAAEALEATVGKELANKILTDLPDPGDTTPSARYKSYSGLDLKVGGEGLKRLYDKTLPSLFKKYGKEGVGEVSIGTRSARPVIAPGFATRERALAYLGGQETANEVVRLNRETGNYDIINPEARNEAILQPFLPVTGRTPESYPTFAREPEKFFSDLSLLAKSNLGRLKNLKPQTAKYWLKGVPLPYVAEMFSPRLPQLSSFYRKTQEMTATQHGIVDGSMLKHQAIRKAARGAADIENLNAAMAAGSWYQITPWADIDRQDWVGKQYHGKGEEAIQAAERLWEASGMPAKTDGTSFEEAYKAARAAYQRLPEAMRKAHREVVADLHAIREREKAGAEALIIRMTEDGSEARQQMLEQFDRLYSDLRGAYVPLARFGDYVATGVNPKTGAVEREQFDTIERRDLAAQSMADRGFTDVRRFKNPVRDKLDQQIPQEFIRKVQEMATEDLGAEEAEEMARALQEMWIRWQPETSALKNAMQRKNVAGYNSDLLRSWLNYSVSHARNIAFTEHGRDLQQLLTDMQNEIKAKAAEGQAPDLEQAIVDDLKARQAALRQSRSNAVSRMLGTVSSFYYMTSPSIYLVQLSQNWVVTLPRLATRYGLKAAGSLLRNTHIVNRRFTREKVQDPKVQKAKDILFGIDPTTGELMSPEPLRKKTLEGLSAYERQLVMLARAIDDNVLDITLSHEALDVAQGRERDKGYEIMHKMMFFMRESELASRRAALLSAFDLEMESSKDFYKAYEQARETAVTTLFDYSLEAKAPVMQGPLGRAMLQFQTYPINMAFRLGRLVHQSLKGLDPETRSLARKEFAGIMGMTFLLAGSSGLPFAGMFFKALDAAGDDDEPVDHALLFEQWLADFVGQRGARGFTQGVPSLLGANLSRRIGLSDAFSLPGADAPEWLHGSGLSAWFAAQAVGPWYSVAEGWFRGYDQMVNKGEYLDGLTSVMPKPVKDGLKAYKLATEGLKDSQGKRLMEDGQVGIDDVFLLAVGFQPEDVAFARETERRLDNMSLKISERRGRLLRDFARAVEADDAAGIDEAIEAVTAFNRKMPAFALKAGDLRGAWRKRAKGDLGTTGAREGLVADQYGLPVVR